METLDVKKSFIELRAKGYSFDKIAKELGKAKQTLIDWSKELQEEIANVKALELEALQEEFYLAKEDRLKRFGGMLKQLRDEVENRDLSDVPTDKLLELYLKYNTQVKEEIIEPVFKSSEEIQEQEDERRLLDQLTGLERKLKTA